MDANGGRMGSGARRSVVVSKFTSAAGAEMAGDERMVPGGTGAAGLTGSPTAGAAGVAATAGDSGSLSATSSAGISRGPA
jgi:hypothetical protein